MSKNKNSVTRTRFRYYLIKLISILIAIFPLFIFALVKWNYIFAVKEQEAGKVLSNMIGFVFLLIFIGYGINNLWRCMYSMVTMGFPGSARGKEPACQCRRCKRHGFHPWVRKIPWRRAW